MREFDERMQERNKELFDFICVFVGFGLLFMLFVYYSNMKREQRAEHLAALDRNMTALFENARAIVLSSR